MLEFNASDIKIKPKEGNPDENYKVEFEATETWNDDIDVKAEPESPLDPLFIGDALNSRLDGGTVPQNQKLYDSDFLRCELCCESHIVFLSMEELESHKRTKHRKLPDLVEIL